MESRVTVSRAKGPGNLGIGHREWRCNLYIYRLSDDSIERGLVKAGVEDNRKKLCQFRIKPGCRGSKISCLLFWKLQIKEREANAWHCVVSGTPGADMSVHFSWTVSGEVHGLGYLAPLLPDIYHSPECGEGKQAVTRECGAQSCDYFFWRFLSIFGNKFLIFKDRILGNREFLVKSDMSLCVSSRDTDWCVQVHTSYPHRAKYTHILWQQWC